MSCGANWPFVRFCFLHLSPGILASQACFSRPKALQVPPSPSNGSLPGETLDSCILPSKQNADMLREKALQMSDVSCSGSPPPLESWPASLHGFSSSLIPSSRFHIVSSSSSLQGGGRALCCPHRHLQAEVFLCFMLAANACLRPEP